MLDVVFAAAIVMALLWVVNAPGVETWRAIAMLVAAAVTVGCWVAWRRQRADGSRIVLVLTLVVAATVFFGDGPGTMPLMFVVLAVLVVEHGPRAGLAAACGVTAIASVMMALAYGQPAENNALQSFATLILLCLGVAIGQLLREVDQARRENARLLAELRASFQAEKDHVLAEERARAARDLHDGLGHQLTAIRMGLDLAERMRGRDDSAAWAEVSRSRDLSVVALDRMRVWVRALDPIPVHALTDAAALEAVAEAFRGTGLDVRVSTSGVDQPLDREKALFALRVAQEGLTNALRHAGARRVDLEVTHTDWLRITLTDDGTAGRDDDAEATRSGDARGEPVTQGYGLRALSERARALGGSVEAGWTRAGFQLRVEVPVARGIAA